MTVRGGAGPTAGKIAIVVSHGSLARGLVSAMETVLGPQPNVFWLSNTGKTPGALQSKIEELITAQAHGRDVYLLTDLRGGSCATTCLRSARRAGVQGVFYGANLTLLLEFVLHQQLPGAQFLETLLAKARNSVDGVLVGEEPAGSREGEAGSGHGGEDGEPSAAGPGVAAAAGAASRVGPA